MENDRFQMKIQAAAVAAWWTVLVAAIVIAVQWLAYLAIIPAQPAWMLSLWGPNASWPEIRTIWLQAIVTLKLGLYAGAALALWLTLWSRQLRRVAGSP